MPNHLKSNKNSEWWPILIVCVGIFFCSQSSTFVRLSNAPSLVLAAYRKTIVTIMLFPFVLTKERRNELLSMGKHRIVLCAISGFCLAIHFWSYFYAVQNTTIAAAQLLCNEVVFVGLFMFITRREKFDTIAILSILIAIMGGVLVAYTSKNAGAQTSLRGNLIAVGSGVMLSSYSLIGAKVRAQCSNTVYTFLAYGFSAIVLDLLVIISPYECFGYDKINYLTAFGMAVCCTLLGHSIFNWSLKYLSPTLVSMLKTFQPVLAAIWGALFFMEIPEWNQIVGGVVVTIGIIMYTLHKEK